jgi:ATP-dependent Clp protease adaptor protein ClpS
LSDDPLNKDPSWTAPLSQNLERTCARAHAIAAQRRARAGAEDFLLALAEDPEAAAVMEACALDRHGLRTALGAAPATRSSVPNVGFLPILHRARANRQASGRTDEVNGAHALAAILTGTSPALVDTLHRHGLTRFDALRFIAHGLRKGEEPHDEGETASAPTLAVKLLNDDYTPMDFVAATLERVFDRDRETAVRTMLWVHSHGAAVCGTFPAALAREKRATVAELARAKEVPLCCVLAVPQSSS